MTDTMNVALVVLSIGTIIGPILFGFLVFKARTFFVSDQQFADYKILAQSERDNMKDSLRRTEEMVRRIEGILDNRR